MRSAAFTVRGPRYTQAEVDALARRGERLELMRRTGLLVLLAALMGAGLVAYVLRQTFTGDDGLSPWLYCTTNPCQPLALFALPTPPALTHDRSLAARCDFSTPGASDGVLLWYTDWDPQTQKGRCVSGEEARRLAG